VLELARKGARKGPLPDCGFGSSQTDKTSGDAALDVPLSRPVSRPIQSDETRARRLRTRGDGKPCMKSTFWLAAAAVPGHPDSASYYPLPRMNFPRPLLHGVADGEGLLSLTAAPSWEYPSSVIACC